MSVMKRLLPAALLALVFSSCYATKDFTIYTDPEGAEISVNGKRYEGQKTPLTITIEQDKDLGITAMKPGYEVASHTVLTQTSTWGTILWTKHDPRAKYIEEDEVTIPLKKIPSASSFAPEPLPSYAPPARRALNSEVPALREMPQF